MLNKWFKISVVIISIIVMVIWAFNYQIKKESIQKNAFTSYTLINELMEVNHKLDDNILKSTIYNTYNNDKINKNIELSSKVFKDIKNSAIYTTKEFPKTKAILNECLSQSIDEIKNIEMLIRKNGQVKNSITFITSNLEKLDNISKKNQKRLLHIVSEIYLIKNSMELSSKDRIDLNLDFLNTDNVKHKEDKMFIQLFKIHVIQLNKNLPVLINLADEILNNQYKINQFIKLKHSIEIENNLANEKLNDEFYAIVLFTFITLIIIIYYIFLSEDEKNKIIKLQNDYKKSVTIDDITGLKNRNAYIDDLKNYDQATAILFDITEFSSINSLYGIDAGDFILKSVANKINKFLDSSEEVEVYKVGADQFVILMSKTSDDEAFKVAENIIITIENSSFKYDYIDQPIFIQVQSGISSKLPYLINSAIALKTVIGDYSKKVAIFDDSLDKTQEIQKNIQMVQKIKYCISNDDIAMLFQPLVDLKTKDIVKYEALVRLKDRDKDEYISPYFFLELSKKAKLYTQITNEVIIKSLEAIKEKDVDISINLSIEDILHKETHDFILKTLANDTQVSQKVTLELLESEEIQDFNALKDFIKKVKSFGCKIAIDDFGSGYSNYNYLLELDVDILKIDGSLIKNIDKSENNQLVVKSIVEFAKLANIKTVAEFVENENIEKVITELGIDYGQGYYYSPPKLL